MAWQNFGSAHYFDPNNSWIKQYYPSAYYYKIQFQYDDSDMSAVSVKCRVVTTYTEGSYYGTDYLFMYTDDPNIGVIRIYNGGANDKEQESSEFRLYKSYNSQYFYMSDFCIFHQGRQGQPVDAFSRSLYDGGRSAWRDFETGSGYAIWGTKVDDNLASSVEIINNGNNTFKFKSVTGGSGANNSATNCHIYYTTDGTEPSSSNYNGGINTEKSDGQTYESGNYSISSTTVVKAMCYTLGTYNPSIGGVASTVVSTEVTFYPAPTFSKKVLNINSSKSKNTKSATYSATWEGSVIKSMSGFIRPFSYRYSLYVNNALIATVDTTDTKCDISSILKNKGIALKKDDNITLKVLGVCKNTLGYEYVTPENDGLEKTITIVSSGVMNIKLNSGEAPKESDAIYVKINDTTWVEATDVYAKVDNTTWVESV